MQYLFGNDAAVKGQGIASPEIQQRLLEAERIYGPEYVRNELARQEMSLFGGGGQQGLLSQAQRTAPIYGDIQAGLFNQQRTADISDVERLGGRATAALRASDPDRQALMGRQTALTNDLYARAGGVTPQQQRMAEQQAREAGQSRGRINDNLSIFGEALGREEFMRQNRAEAMQAGAGLFGMYQATSADPFQAILGRPAGAMPYAQATGQQALGMSQQPGPSLFNPDAGINLALQNNANQANYQASIYGAQAGQRGAMLGGLFGGVGSVLGGYFGR
jgi:hypothetical protein